MQWSEPENLVWECLNGIANVLTASLKKGDKTCKKSIFCLYACILPEEWRNYHFLKKKKNYPKNPIKTPKHPTSRKQFCLIRFSRYHFSEMHLQALDFHHPCFYFFYPCIQCIVSRNLSCLMDLHSFQLNLNHRA